MKAEGNSQALGQPGRKYSQNPHRGLVPHGCRKENGASNTIEGLFLSRLSEASDVNTIRAEVCPIGIEMITVPIYYQYFSILCALLVYMFQFLPIINLSRLRITVRPIHRPSLEKVTSLLAMIASPARSPAAIRSSLKRPITRNRVHSHARCVRRV